MRARSCGNPTLQCIQQRLGEEARTAFKFDRAFTDEMAKSEKGNAFFKAIITMAHTHEMRVVAEGIKTERQIEVRRNLQCDEAQEY